jgi:16S rRNA (adenine1518-N6/adenine1519-N6)-dimethyltransferase
MPPQHERRPGRSRAGIPVRKRWGQHFLVRPEIAERIVEAARVEPEDSVLEIGPGDGALTRPLARRAACVAAVEIDPLRARALAAELAGHPRVRIICGDALARPIVEWVAEGGCAPPALLVANLPYSVATPLLLGSVESGAIRRCVVTVQREVARRFVARAGDEGYGFLSVRARLRSTGRILFDLPPGAFRPRPKVVSSVLELFPRDPAADAETVRRALALASLGFNARRKTLPNALAAAGPRERWEGALEALGKGPRARAEELSPEEYIALAREWRP